MPNSIWQRYIQSPIKDLRCSFWRRQLTVPEVYSQRSRTSKMKLFERNFFSRPLLQPFTMYTKNFILDVPPYSLNIPLEPLTIFAIGSILMFDWVLDTPLTCLKKDKNCEKPVKELFLETLQQRLEIISKRFLRKTLLRNDFLHSCFQQVL